MSPGSARPAGGPVTDRAVGAGRRSAVPGGPVTGRAVRASAGRRPRVRGGPVAGHGDRGSAVAEVVLLGIPLLVPLVFLAVAVGTVQQAKVGVTEAARQAGRAYVTGTAATAAARATGAARLTLADRGIPAGAVRIAYAAAGTGCAGATAVPPPLRPGATVTVCVTAQVAVLGTRRDVTGRFAARADLHRDYG